MTESLNGLRWWNGIDAAVDALVAVFAMIVLFRRAVVAWYREDATLENKWQNRIQCLTFWVLMIVVSLVCGMVQGVADKMANPRKLADKFPRLRVAELKARADLGDAASMWRLGNWERNGWLGEKHPDKAVEWYRKAADRGDRFALNDLGDCYEKGIGTETNLEETVACWVKAAEKKHGWAACKVAIRYQKDKKQKEAFGWFRKSADLGNSYGCCKLGECYEKGWGTETNAVLAAEWFLKGAERRHGWGMEKTGDFYRDGYGVEKDLDKAREWYEKAVNRGNKNAQRKLDALKREEHVNNSHVQKITEAQEVWKEAEAYFKGTEGYPKDWAKSRELYLKAGEMSSSPADGGKLAQLGTFFDLKQGPFERDYVAAAKWYRKGVDLGNSWCMGKLSILYREGHGVEKNVTNALKYAQMAADKELGHYLAEHYEQGVGVEKNLTKAFELRKAEAEWLNPVWDRGGPSFKVGELYEKGIGTPSDMVEAVKWYRKAKSQGNKKAEEQLQKLGTLTKGEP